MSNLKGAEVLDRQFKTLTGFSPLSWQSRLFSEYFEKGEIPAAVDIPTGLGKTAVMALWLIARASGAQLPRRLVYVVDRRAVVDQATEFADLLCEKLDSPEAADLKKALELGDRSLPISTLRGQHVDNREWLENPALTAIIVGTVDMIGSRLLFEGYGVSRKMRPYHAGLLGADALVVLDEAHLVPPFEKLLEAIEQGSDQFAAHAETDRRFIPPFKLLSLSATGRERSGTVFQLRGSFNDPVGQRFDLDDAVVEQRLKAKKAVKITPAASEKLEEDLAQHAWKLTDSGKLPLRCIIFCNRRETAEKTKDAIETLAEDDKKQGRPAIDIDPPELFVGARRVLERTDAAKKLAELGFVAGLDAARTKPAFLIATSAGEVGVDLDADHMVCDLVAWERMIQRLGRVNRRGKGDAKAIVVFEQTPSPNKAAKAALAKSEESRNDTDRKAIASHEALIVQAQTCRKPIENTLDQNRDGSFDASPNAIRSLKERAAADPKIAEIIKAATTSAPLRPTLTRPLVDAWSMTSLEEHTGRPEIAPWLRGWVEEEPQTSVVWRTHLPSRISGAEATKKEIETFFEAAPPHASEELETEAYRVKEWLLERAAQLLRSKRWNAAGEGEADQEPGRSVPDTLSEPQDVSIRALQGNDIVAFVLSKSGDWRETWRLRDLREPNDKKSKDNFNRDLYETLSGAILITDARFSGLRDGMLDAKQAGVAKTADDGSEWMAPNPNGPVVPFRIRAVMSVEQTAETDWRKLYSFVVERNGEYEPTRWLLVEKWRNASLTEEGRSASRRPQFLEEHQSWTEMKARELALKLGFERDFIEALAISARLHDEGKKASRWQRAFKAPLGAGVYAKTKGPIDFALLDGYRHEFGSLPHAQANTDFKKLTPDLQNLVLHLIAAHHGQARPVIGTNGCEDAPPSALEPRAREVALRFAHLQKRWGPWGLAWWEALLRAADQQASRANDERDGKDS